MMEAAVAYYEATGKDRLLQVMLKNAECIYHYFVTEGHAGYPGHPEVELALLRMYRVTGRKLCLELAEHFLNVRGCLLYTSIRGSSMRTDSIQRVIWISPWDSMRDA